MICDDFEVQKSLPQFLLIRESTLSIDRCFRLSGELGDNIVLLRLQRAWANEAAIKELFVRLRVALFEFRTTHEFIVYADAFKRHITRAVWRAAANGRFPYCLVAASLTWALQPCDVYAMAPYKRYLTSLWARRVSVRGRQALTILEVIRCIDETVQSYLHNHDWSFAFQHLGLCGHQLLVSWSVLNKLGLHDIPPQLSTLPSLAQLQLVFPRRTALPLDDMFALYS